MTGGPRDGDTAVESGEPLDDLPFSIDFFEVVRVRTADGNRGAGSRGTVLGRSRADGVEFYAIDLDDGSGTTMVAAVDLEPTGERRPREDIYGGARIRVSERGEPLEEGAPRRTRR